MKLNRNKLRKMILAEMFGMGQPRGPEEEEMAAQAIQQCVQTTLDSGPTIDNPGRPVMRERLDNLRMGMGDPKRVTFALNIRTQEPAAQCAADFGIPHLENYIRIKTFNLIAQMYGLSKRY